MEQYLMDLSQLKKQCFLIAFFLFKKPLFYKCKRQMPLKKSKTTNLCSENEHELLRPTVGLTPSDLAQPGLKISKYKYLKSLLGLAW